MRLKGKIEREKMLLILSISFSVLLVFSNLIAGRLIEVMGFVLPAAVLIFPITYILGDDITDIYGFNKTRIDKNSDCVLFLLKICYNKH